MGKVFRALVPVLLLVGLGPGSLASEASDAHRGTSRSGAAIAGSQVTSVASNGGRVTIRARNRSRGARATSGSVGSEVISGAQDDTTSRQPSPTSHDGSDERETTSFLVAESGNAVAGSQIIAVSSDGDVVIDAINDSENGSAFTEGALVVGAQLVALAPSDSADDDADRTRDSAGTVGASDGDAAT